jgi:hypothetical protein
MKRASLVFVAVLALSGARSEAQLLLRAGESYTQQFTDLPYLYYVTAIYPPYCLFTIRVIPGSFAPGTAVRWEMFMDSPSEAPFRSGVLTEMPSYEHTEAPFPGWDRSGAYRLTVLSGSLILHQVVTGANINRLNVNDYYAATNFPPPRVVHHRIDRFRTRLSWTTNAVGYQLESSPGLPVSTWSPVTNVAAVADGNYTLNVVTVQGQRFFRLAKP